MKLISLTLSILLFLFVSACTSSASIAANEGNKAETSKIEDHINKFKGYFRIHTSKQHLAEQDAFEEAQWAVREQKAKEKAEAKAAKGSKKNTEKDALVALKEEPVKVTQPTEKLPK